MGLGNIIEHRSRNHGRGSESFEHVLGIGDLWTKDGEFVTRQSVDSNVETAYWTLYLYWYVDVDRGLRDSPFSQVKSYCLHYPEAKNILITRAMPSIISGMT